MNRKEFLQASGLLLPMSFLSGNSMLATTQTEVDNQPVDYLKSQVYQKHARKLRFNANGKFKIVQFTDVHWVPGKLESEVAGERIAEILDAEKPDFVVFTGDVVFGKPAKTGYEKAFAPVIKRNIPFAFTFGNHDDEQDMTRQEIHEMICQMPGNLNGTVKGLHGISNFILPIQSAQNPKSAFLLYHFDSLSYSPNKAVDGYDWIKQDQIDWYCHCAEQFKAENQGIALPALAFFHIPLPEYNQAASSESTTLIGIRKEPVCAPKVNSGLFSAMLEMGDVMGVFVGHDHVNDYITTWKGILLGYGRYTGGKTVYCDVPWGNGARVIELTEGERSFDTWVCLKKGKRIFEANYPKDFSKEPW